MLERCVLAQQASTYELSGEYVLPPGMTLPSTLLPEPGVGGMAPPTPLEDNIEGRWRLQVNMAAAQCRPCTDASCIGRPIHLLAQLTQPHRTHPIPAVGPAPHSEFSGVVMLQQYPLSALSCLTLTRHGTGLMAYAPEPHRQPLYLVSRCHAACCMQHLLPGAPAVCALLASTVHCDDGHHSQPACAVWLPTFSTATRPAGQCALRLCGGVAAHGRCSPSRHSGDSRRHWRWQSIISQHTAPPGRCRIPGGLPPSCGSPPGGSSRRSWWPGRWHCCARARRCRRSRWRVW